MRAATKTLEDFSIYDFGGPGINLTGGDRPEQLKGVHVSANYFRVFGAPLALGRTFSAEEDRPGGPRVAVISYSLWRSHFGGDRGIVGKVIELANTPYVVTGVLGRSFQPNPPADIWLPLQANPNSIDEAHYLLGAAMLKPGASLGQAQAELKIAVAAFKRKFPTLAQMMGAQVTFTARPLRDAEVDNVRTLLLVLLGAVGFVLLIACANVANLLLARATIRKRELAIRAAVGAGRGRIIRQLLTESVLLSLAGGAAGLVIGYVGVRSLLAINPGNIPRIGEKGSAVALDWRVLLFTVVVAVLTGILFGLIPALSASRSDLNATLKESGARSGTGLRQNKSRSALVIVEMALALVLLVGAALLIRTFVAMQMVDPGFYSHGVLTMQMSLAGDRFQKTSEVALMEREAEERVGSIPGVVKVTATCSLPLQGQYGLPFNIVGQKPTGKSPYTGGAEWTFVSPQFFSTFQIPLIRGRFFTDLDTAGNPHVAIINEAMAKKYWKKGNPVGSQIIIGQGVGPEFNEPAREIVGIVGNVRDYGLNNDPPDIMYVPAAQLNDGVTALGNGLALIYWAVRAKVPPFSLTQQIQQQLRDVTGGLPVAHIQSMDQVDRASRLQYGAVHDFRGSRFAAGRNRDVWADRVLRRATHPGNWHQNGSWSKSAGRAQHGRKARNEARADWSGNWRWRRTGANPFDRQHALWREGLGSGRVYRGRRGAEPDRLGGYLYSRPPGGACRCGGGAPVRIRVRCRVSGVRDHGSGARESGR